MPEHINVHILGLSETNLKDQKSTEVFKLNGFQAPFRKDNDSNGGGLQVYVRNGINAKRRDDQETNNILCLWLEITLHNSKSFLLGNMYRLPDSTIEFNDQFGDLLTLLLAKTRNLFCSGTLRRIY